MGELYRPEGSGPFPLLIYSHGYGYRVPEYSMEALAGRGIAACSFDFCGGAADSRSDGSSLEMTVRTEADDLCAVLDTLKQLPYVDRDRIYLSGHSQGGFVSTMVGVERSDEIRGMFLLSPAYFITDTGPYLLLMPNRMEVGNMTISKAYFSAAARYNLFREMRKYHGRVILYHGTEDGMAPIRYSQKALNYFPDAELYTINGAGHDYSAKESELIQNDIICRILEDSRSSPVL